jgi:hypothetical protein
MRKLILFIHAGHPIEIEAAKLSRRDFAEYVYELEEFSVVDPQAHAILKNLLRDRSHELFFFYSMNFWALNIRNGDKLLHRLTGIPLAVMMHDHPVYFLHQLSPSLNGIVIVAPGEELPDFIAKHYGIAATAIGDPGFRPHLRAAGPAPNFDDFSNRRNMLLCPMNLNIAGQNIDDIWATIKALPEPRRKRAVRLIDAALTDCMTPLHLISERLSASGDPELAVEDLRWVLNYVKLWRRMWLIEKLVDLPILISSAYVPADLERRYPEKFTLLTRSETIPLYRQFRFVVNTNPLIHCFHERVTEALIGNSVCVTDRNIVIDRYFQDDRDMVFVDYTRPDLAERLTQLIDDPQRAFELTVNSYKVRMQPAFSGDAHRELIDTINELWTAKTQPTE